MKDNQSGVIRISVKVFGSLILFTGVNSLSVDVDLGSTVKDVKKTIGIPVDHSCTILVNSIPSKINTTLNDKDSVKFLMNVSGG